jgi:2,5-diamino-6-(ribosylamino)-4(3H)-pyrimidinone 5'-phosphate reductase
VNLPVNHPYMDLTFPSSPGDRPYVAVNMVMSLDGKITVGKKLEAGSLGSGFDRDTMTVLRHHFDAVICGGETVRQHPFYLGVTPEFSDLRKAQGMTLQPRTIIVTNSGLLPRDSALFSKPEFPPIILTSKQSYSQIVSKLGSLAEVYAVGEDQVEVGEALKLLRQVYAVDRLLLEGGPRLNFQFMQEQAVDEVFLTLAPRLVGSKDELSMVMGDSVLESLPRLKLISHFQHADELFLRYRVPIMD